MPRKQKKYHFIYKTTNLLNEKFYVGMHSTDNLEDGYTGSGKILNYSIRKYGVENHQVEILEFLSSREELKKREAEVVNEELLANPLCMNLKFGGDGGGKIWNAAHAEAFHSAGALASNKLRAGKPSSDFHKEQTSKGVKEAYAKNGSHWLGKHQSEEHRRKIGEKNSNLQKGEGNSQFGTCWVCKGSEVKKIKREDLQFWISQGWKNGRK